MAEIAKSNIGRSQEIANEINVLNAQILSFILPNTKNVPHYYRDVREYELEVFTQPQTGQKTNGRFRILVYLEFKIIFKDDMTLNASLQSEVGFQVNLKDETKLFKLSELDTDVIMAAVSIAYSTTRGLLSERAKGTTLEGAILPVIAPVDLMNEPPPEISGIYPELNEKTEADS